MSLHARALAPTTGDIAVSDPIVVYHNPRCSTSRSAHALIREIGEAPEVVEYLKTSLDAGALRELLDALDVPARDLVRRGEAPYRELGLADPATTEDELIAAVAAHPILMQRPIVRRGARAVMARPPERAADLLDT